MPWPELLLWVGARHGTPQRRVDSYARPLALAVPGLVRLCLQVIIDSQGGFNWQVIIALLAGVASFLFGFVNGIYM